MPCTFNGTEPKPRIQISYPAFTICSYLVYAYSIYTLQTSHTHTNGGILISKQIFLMFVQHQIFVEPKRRKNKERRMENQFCGFSAYIRPSEICPSSRSINNINLIYTLYASTCVYVCVCVFCRLFPIDIPPCYRWCLAMALLIVDSRDPARQKAKLLRSLNEQRYLKAMPCGRIGN